MSEHTPGLWEVWESPDGWTVRARYRDVEDRRCTSFVAICSSGNQPNEANARLMASAPVLAAELTRLCEAIADILRALGSENTAERILDECAELARKALGDGR